MCAADPALGFTVVDVDRFKSVNDRFGHSAGDEVARTGGEELALAAHIGHRDVADLAKPIRTAVRDSGDDIPVTVSVGAAIPSAGHGQRPLPDLATVIVAGLTVADDATYAAKAARGDSVVVRHLTARRGEDDRSK